MKTGRTVRIVLIGIGTVGGELVRQLAAERARWRRDYEVDVGVAAIVTRAGALVAANGELADEVVNSAVDRRRAGQNWLDAAGQAALAANPEEAITRVAATGPTVVVDAGAGEETASLDALALEHGAGVVLSNKAPLALPAASPVGRALWAAAGAGGRLRYEATCGAGLPVFSTLRAMIDTGDEIREILGAVSGTLGAIFSDVESGRAFSLAIHAARGAGYTEPDPRDDLSGLDVARKALILARTIGRSADLGDVAVEGLVPDHLAAAAGVSVAEFLERAGPLDEGLAARSSEARDGGRVLRYVAEVSPDRPLAVGVRGVAAASVLGALRGPENAVSIRSARYDAFPLGISGPGAGAAVTAAGIAADVLSLAIGPPRSGR